jgi:hypothetical protein
VIGSGIGKDCRKVGSWLVSLTSCKADIEVPADIFGKILLFPAKKFFADIHATVSNHENFDLHRLGWVIGIQGPAFDIELRLGNVN